MHAYSSYGACRVHGQVQTDTAHLGFKRLELLVRPIGCVGGRRTANGGRATFAGTYVNAIVSDATIITEKNRITAWNAGADERRWSDGRAEQRRGRRQTTRGFFPARARERKRVKKKATRRLAFAGPGPGKAKTTRTRTVGPDDGTTGGRQRGGSIRGREGPRDDANARAIGETATRLGEASFG